MSERDSSDFEGGGATVIELLLREPDVAAWLAPAADDEADDDYEPPHAA